MELWKICHRDRYPAYIDWTTFEIIQGMIRDNHSEYAHNKSRGIPRAGKALLHGIVYTLADAEPTYAIRRIGCRTTASNLKDRHTHNHETNCPNNSTTEGNRTATQGNP